MGTFFHPITIIGPNGEQTIEALVDTTQLFAAIPRDILDRLGVRAKDRKHTDSRSLAQTQARLGNQDGWAMCIFGEPGEQAIIGRHTLDGFVLDIDEHGSLIPKVLHEIRHF